MIVLNNQEYYPSHDVLHIEADSLQQATQLAREQFEHIYDEIIVTGEYEHVISKAEA